MTRQVDKNDVDISQLFKWSARVIISDAVTNTEATIYLRLVGDSDLNRAKTYGYRRASELRKSLRTEDSDDRVAFLAELEDYDDTSVIAESILLLEMPEMYQEAVQSVDLLEPKEPKSDADQEKWEIYQEEVDSYPDRFSKETMKRIKKLQSSRKRVLKKEKLEDLYKIYENTVINRLCEEALQSAYYSMCVYFGSYKDEKFKRRVFSSFAEYDNAHRDLKVRLMDEYKELEIGTDLLKKLPEATD